jgi:hypothetical protein
VGLDDRLFRRIGKWKRVVETYPTKARHDVWMRPNPTAERDHTLVLRCRGVIFNAPTRLGCFLFTNMTQAADLRLSSLAEDVATPVGAVEAYYLSSFQRQRVAALLEMMRRAVDVDG